MSYKLHYVKISVVDVIFAISVKRSMAKNLLKMVELWSVVSEDSSWMMETA